IVFAIVLVTIIINVNKTPNLDYQLEEVKEINYMVVMDNNKYGVINKNGDVLIEPYYDEVQIPNPSKPLFICMYDYDVDKNQYKIKVFNDKKEQILYQYVVVEAIPLNSGISPIPYEKSVLKFKEKDKYGLIDFNGKVIAKAKYDDIQSFDYNEGLLLVKKHDKYGIININGVTVVKEKFDKIESDAYYEEGSNYKKSGYIVAMKKGDSYKYGFISNKGKKILDTKFDQIARLKDTAKNDDIYLVAFEKGKAGFYKNNKKILKNEYEDIGYDDNNNCLILQQNGKQGLADFNGNVTIEIKYDNIYISGRYVNAQDGNNIDIYDYTTKKKMKYPDVVGINQTASKKYSIAIMKNDKFRVFDSILSELKEEEYDSLEFAYDNCFITFKDGKFGIVDSKGNKVIDFKYNLIQKIPNSNVIEAINNDKNTIDFISDGKVVLSTNNSQMYIKDKYIVVESNNNRSYLDYNGNVVENKDVLKNELYASRKGKKWGFVNENGEYVINPTYDFVTEFNEYGFAGVKKDGKWGSINLKGEIIIEPTYVIDLDSPNFIGQYYENYVMYGESYFTNK
nr:WG repeat-containing protein [Clostridia bacterium]